MDYQFRQIESEWQKFWAENQTFKVENHSSKPKYYVMDMFPYPSGAGLHVGHPLGYIASDIFARYKRLKGFNVLHPMGYDSFGLPAEQYAIQTGQHPAITTEQNIATYRRQLDQIGFSFDWSREVRTSSPDYYKWTQWIFMQLFNSWYNLETDKAESISTLIQKFEAEGNHAVKAASDEDVLSFSAEEYASFTDQKKQEELLKYRLTYLRESTVNWCPALGTVLANDEVKDGFSERGGYPVEQKKMMQWSMRITAYAERLLQGLDTIDWPEPLKEMQRNWIGKSVGAMVRFGIERGANPERGAGSEKSEFASPLPAPQSSLSLEVFTTRVDTIFGVTFVVLAPEHELVKSLTTPGQQADIDTYIDQAKKKSELDRMADTKTVSGAFTGSYVINPLDGKKIPVWIADYVLAGYGTGAVMGVPSGDARDHRFATHFNLPIVAILDTQKDVLKEADATKEGHYINSGFINGMEYKEATAAVIVKLEELNAGKAKINYRQRDAIFGRQRYWGEPVPVYFKDGLPQLIDQDKLPLVLPEVDKYLPTESGEPPLARAENWKYQNEFEYELSTMPGWAGSSWYWYRYMDPKNGQEFASKEAIAYWKDVDLYIGGSEHATGHLLYSRFWNKFLKDLGLVVEEEPFKKLINQGMIQGVSEKINISGTSGSTFYMIQGLQFNFPNTERLIISQNVRERIDETLVNTEWSKAEVLYATSQHHVDIKCVNSLTHELDIHKFIEWRPEFKNAIFWCSGGCWQNGSFKKFEGSNGDDKFYTKPEVEKMSKSKFNVVNPDEMIERYGADTLRMYEMFLGPLEQSKPWNTNGIEGVFKFLRKFWKLFHDDNFNFRVINEAPTKAELKTLHKIIKKVEDDVERFSFNTSVSSFMIAVNELTELKCAKRSILQDMVIILSPYAPHICEELWKLLGNEAGTLSYATYPKFNPEFLVEDAFSYPISINGKTKTNLNIPLSLDPKEVETLVLADENVQKYLGGKTPKKVIVVKGRIVNMVV
ncbi:leucine--tRNA ligase [Mucilaginibacter arboris]|uniref:Leucine--tRNA ligase n=1 Tax=Mucilaginibacter arboris TaxID=2682090 RepID=A0A7K1SWE5_9SPHI|nr:class I tRNA ligase family protein [Mucilaginibacter arboris]MVN21567.1 leucine--tRNA ligase [Mucilaginibacter arboris]